MKTTYSWLREYSDPNLPGEEVARRLSMSGCLVEEIHPLPNDLLFVAEITSNRPDLLGTLGMAREVSALTGAPLRLPPAQFTAGTDRVEGVAAVEVRAPDLCPRYTARVIRGVQIGPSPDWLRARLESIGVRSINNVVDVTNYVMFECGQPLHAFDFDKLHGGRIVVRRPAEGETLVSIDGTTCKLNPAMLVIADADRPVAIAGIMGGVETEIGPATVNVLLESAQFENTNIRRTSRALQLASDSSYRFERGVDPVQTEWASRRAAHLIQQVAGGTVLDGVCDVWAAPYSPRPVTLRLARLNLLLGAVVAPDIARAILERLGFIPLPQSDPRELTVLVPAWRANDVSREVDLIEEIIRIYGYDKVPESGALTVTVGRISHFERVSDGVRRQLAGEGFFEVVTNSFADESAAGLASPWTAAAPFIVQNTIRRDENRLRVSLLPAFLTVKQTNLAHGVAKSPLFEISRIFLRKPPRAAGQPEADDRLPEERQVLALLDEEDLLHVKGVIEALADACGFAGRLRFEAAAMPFFAEGRAARITLDGQLFGVVGQVAPAACQKYDIVHPPCMAELDFDRLVQAANLERAYQPLPSFPAAVRDLAVVVDEATPWSQIEETVRALRIPILAAVEFFDIFRGKQVPAGKKSIAFSLTFRAPDRTLTSEEVESARQACIQALTARGAQLRG